MQVVSAFGIATGALIRGSSSSPETRSQRRSYPQRRAFAPLWITPQKSETMSVNLTARRRCVSHAFAPVAVVKENMNSFYVAFKRLHLARQLLKVFVRIQIIETLGSRR